LFNWDQLRGIGEIKVVRLTILAPFIGYLILFNEQLIHFLNISNELLPAEYFRYFWQDTSKTSEELASSRLFLIYFGLFFLGLGSILYGIACPHLLKRYGSSSEYLRDELTFQTKFQVQRALDELKELKSKPTHLNGLVSQFEQHFEKIKSNDNGEFSSEFQELSKDLMIEHWKTQNVSHRLARHSTFIAYFFGFLIIAIPSIETLLAVSKAFWK
jgi:hypothetical protein